ncbi:hypothetical protein ABMA28_016944 [Loxostege sticticalis]|uniref:Orcokinin n=1 Tax=Loxostege sticticalis TaxID=481309 RepID=A0ABD0T6G0_LOXSC
MMRGARALAVAAALIVCCSADNNHQEPDVSGGERSGERYDVGLLKEEYDLMRLLQNYQDSLEEKSLTEGIDRPFKRRGIGLRLGRLGEWVPRYTRVGENSFQRRNVHGTSYLNNIGGSSLIGRSGGDSDNNDKYGISSALGRGEIVDRESTGATQFLRNLDPIGGGNLVKKNLDHIGGPNLVKKNLDSLGGGNLVRRLDPMFGRFIRQLDSIGGGQEKDLVLDHPGGGLVRAVRDTGHVIVPYLMSRRYDYASPFGKREAWPAAPARVGGYYPDLPKRNFDEIDRSGLDQFVIKRNFDEIDQTSMPFPYATKRFYLYGTNHFDIDTPVSSFDKKRYRPDYPMDEIDLSHFPIGSKRSQDGFRPTH